MTVTCHSRITLRNYQQEAIDTIAQKGDGSWLIHMATGLGKTVCFANIPRQGRTLILSHRAELVTQPLKYFDCDTGIEKGKKTSNGEEVISASVQSLAKRLDRFSDDYFHTIITDECHHATASTYQKIYEHFNPAVHLGFTATPQRGDGVGLSRVFDEIIFSRDIKWGIEKKWLADIECMRINIGFDISQVATSMGDLAIGELEEQINISSANHAIAEAYREYAQGQTLIFAVNVNHANAIAGIIPGAVAVSGSSKDRLDIVEAFKDGEINCLVNCSLFTEGTDFPNIETIIMARPTKSAGLYTQMVGRGTRQNKTMDKKCLLIDCVGTSGRHNLCSAPTLIGLDASEVANPERVQGDLLMDIPAIVERESDNPRSWIKNAEIVSLWSRQNSYDLHDVNWYRLPDGSFTLSGMKLKIHPPDELHQSILYIKGKPSYEGHIQQLFDQAYIYLTNAKMSERAIWDKRIIKKWGSQPASLKQLRLIKKKKVDIDYSNLSKADACNIITRVLHG
jgi:superfamily II DNA or RNA helicase